MASKPEISICWLRRDLRLQDQAALYHALKGSHPVLLLFIFDTEILKKLELKKDRRVDFIHQTLTQLSIVLKPYGASIKVMHGTVPMVFETLRNEYQIRGVYTNNDYESYGIHRDATVSDYLSAFQIPFHSFKDQVGFEKNEVIKDDGSPYTVFTPYSVKWKKTLKAADYAPHNSYGLLNNLYQTAAFEIPSLQELGFEKTELIVKVPDLTDELLQKYKDQRDYPALAGTSRLSVHLRFGTVSIRSLIARSINTSATWLNELIWRDFYMMILFHFPHVEHLAFKKKYNQIPWRNDEGDFQKWCEGKTGFPIVDAGMRELNATGFMHNRVRMITSSFLVKDLLINWKWGEAYFAVHLNDYDLSANNGGWQWAAGSGCDAAPYFRIFNPTEQQKKFDPDFKYIKKWLPEFGTPAYPAPMVDHAAARLRTLDVYKKALTEFQ